MKMKVTTAIAALAVTFMLGSCKKTYECHCDTTGGAHEDIDIKAKNKSDAETECRKMAESGSSFAKCEIE